MSLKNQIIGWEKIVWKRKQDNSVPSAIRDTHFCTINLGDVDIFRPNSWA